MEKTRAADFVVFGVVQGVGFRPFIYRTARRLGYKGWVKNIGSGVEIHLESVDPTDFHDFSLALEKERPSLSKIERLDVQPASYLDCPDFKIEKTGAGGSFVFISPDICVCENCLRELHDPSDRRYRYPFINCTDCGPRYTIVENLPYDRDKTTMSGFRMCPKCRREYTDPMDRRYHAQPIACSICGPEVTLLKQGRPVAGGIERAAELIRSGEIVAVKGLGGFHLICNALDPEAVCRLREIKNRRAKPLALMARDPEIVERHARLDPIERELLLSVRRPIVLLQKRSDISGIAPGLDEMGFMLPYTPLHDLLLEKIPLVVATSSNPKDAPIITDEKAGVMALADHILTHNRPIRMRADDSVMKITGGRPLFIRRARGYVPHPQPVPAALAAATHVLALGGELKNTISIYKEGYVVTSQFLGDLDDYRNLGYFRETIEHLSRLFQVDPKIAVSDLHPDFQSTRVASRMGLPHLQVQHHYAHMLAVLLEHGVPPDTRALGIIFDGYGYGADGTAWGGEFLLGDFDGYRRIGHLDAVPLPGGDLAARQPWRMALSWLRHCGMERETTLPVFDRVDPKMLTGVGNMIERGFHCPPTSSAGRLFDAIAFLTGIAPVMVEYEAQAPMLLEAAARRDSGGQAVPYPFELEQDGAAPDLRISFAPAVAGIISDIHSGTPASRIAARFHLTLAEMMAAAAESVLRTTEIDTVVLAGGVMLNRYLLEKAEALLTKRGFRVLRPIRYSPNDESISLGQIAYALRRQMQNPE